MIGIVLVSHSSALAEGLADLVLQVSGEDVRILPAGGTRDGGIGTDPDRIAAAIRQADSGEGVLVLVDIGSAVLAVRAIMAGGDVDGVDVRLADAPLVEGAVAAAVLASTGADLQTAAAAAEEARDVGKL
ncbi:MAG TPA: dihydroxyacetone kinase phosphoryl donor subunit DhaM [Gaiellales bacterium]